MKTLDFHAELTRAGAMSRGPWARIGLLIRRYPLGAIGAAILAVFVFAAVFAGYLTGFDAVSTDARLSLAAPSAQHPLGADFMGRDVYSRIVYGARISLAVGLSSTFLGGVLCLALGLPSGYLGGWFRLSVKPSDR